MPPLLSSCFGTGNVLIFQPFPRMQANSLHFTDVLRILIIVTSISLFVITWCAGAFCSTILTFKQNIILSALPNFFLQFPHHFQLMLASGTAVKTLMLLIQTHSNTDKSKIKIKHFYQSIKSRWLLISHL